MGREIRRVPKGWEHPQYRHCPHWGGLKAHGNGKCYIPKHDQDFNSAMAEWEAEEAKWKRGELDILSCETYADYAGPKPSDEDRMFYRPAWTPEEMTCYQIYETVSEGTPTSPVFESLEEMEDWLVKQGYSCDAAHNFCEDGWVPSMVIGGGKIYRDIESAAIPKDTPDAT